LNSLDSHAHKPRKANKQDFATSFLLFLAIWLLIPVVSLIAPLEGLAMEKNKNLQTAMFAAGCFWGVEQTFREMPGVVSTEVGYTGGTVKNPTYEQVCTSRTGHAETVRLQYDPEKISYEKLLETFFANHNPTTVDRQGPDVGPQYRSAIFYENPEQEALAKAYKEKLDKSGKFQSPIVTQIVPAQDFFKAEEYHQQYLEKRGQKVCH